MRNCGICYEPHRYQNFQANKPFAEREFIIPALLPLSSKAKAASNILSCTAALLNALSCVLAKPMRANRGVQGFSARLS